MRFKGNYKTFKTNSSENPTYQLFWNAGKEVLTGKIKALNTSIRKQKDCKLRAGN